MRIIIVGGGIAGLSAAIALGRQGHAVTVLERQPRLRTEGYMVDFFGPGFDAAEELGLLPALERIHQPVSALSLLDERDRERAHLPYPRLRDALFGGRHFNFMRGELEDALFGALPSGVDVRFGAAPRSVRIDAEGVEVDGARYDLLVGADGVRSWVRDRFFASDTARIELGCRTAAYVVDGIDHPRAGRAFASFSTADKTAAVYPVRGGRFATFFVYRVDGPARTRDRAGCREELERTFRGTSRLADALLDGFPGAGLYFDDVVQIAVERWHRDRVVLLGDACGCVSLVAGQGASLAVAGARVLAEAIGQEEDPTAALARYESRMKPEVTRRQRSGRRHATWFLPPSRVRAAVRDRLTNVLLRSPVAGVLGKMLAGRPGGLT